MDLKSTILQVLNASNNASNASSDFKVNPQNPEQFARLFREASKAGLKLVISGLSTQGNATSGRLEVSTLNLNSWEKTDRDNLILIVGAGIRFDELKKLTKDENIKWSDYKGTVGGCLCGRRDTLVHQQLASRILRITYISPRGEIMQLGTFSVKDVAGYRMAPFLFGSRGRLGLIAQVTLNLSPIFREYCVEFSKINSDFISKDLPTEKIIRNLINSIDPAGIFN